MLRRATLAALTTLLLLAGTAFSGEPELLGFRAERIADQHALEQRFDELLSAEQIGGWIERMSAHPHPVGSAYGKANAEFMHGLLTGWGWDAELVEYQVLFPTPKVRHLEMLEPESFVASLSEGPVEADATSGQTDEQLPGYNAYSIDGDVTAEVVFVNYGIPDDYLELEKRGISVEGKIVLARYYGSWRGIKPKVAAENGAIGCLIYSDPEDDGFFQGDT